MVLRRRSGTGAARAAAQHGLMDEQPDADQRHDGRDLPRLKEEYEGEQKEEDRNNCFDEPARLHRRSLSAARLVPAS